MELTDQQLAQLPAKRRCGECDLCCTAMGVEGVPDVPKGDKRPGVRCPKLAGKPGASCSIYADRPYACRAFLCLWRGSDKLLPENMHPARVGFVVAQGGEFGQFPPVITIHPGPDFPNAWKNPRWRPVFFGLAAKFNAIVVVGQGELARHIFSPRGNEFSRAKWPDLFKDNGQRIGLPDFEFLPWRLSRLEMVQLLFDV